MAAGRKKPLELKILKQNTPRPIRSRANQYKQFQLLGWHQGKDKNGTYNQVTYLVQCTDGSRRATMRFYEGVASKSPVWCSCSCPYFLYYLEVALTRYNSSSIIYSNGKYPTVRNSSLKPYLCKHLYLASRLALKPAGLPKNKQTEAATTKASEDSLPRTLLDLVGSSNAEDLRENREER